MSNRHNLRKFNRRDKGWPAPASKDDFGLILAHLIYATVGPGFPSQAAQKSFHPAR
jgi:hypothetical protein